MTNYLLFNVLQAFPATVKGLNCVFGDFEITRFALLYIFCKLGATVESKSTTVRSLWMVAPHNQLSLWQVGCGWCRSSHLISLDSVQPAPDRLSLSQNSQTGSVDPKPSFVFTTGEDFTVQIVLTSQPWRDYACTTLLRKFRRFATVLSSAVCNMLLVLCF